MPEDAEWVTVAQAAQLLGVAERQARRMAARLPDRDRTNEPGPGGRPRLMIRFASLEAARAGPDTPPDTDRTDAPPSGGARSVPLAHAYERIIEGKDAQIAQLAAALDHERQMSKSLADALAREQTLRALPPPAPEASESGETKSETKSEGTKWRWPWQRKESEDK